MLDWNKKSSFQRLNRAYNEVFRPGRLTLGLVVPLDAHGDSPQPDMTGHLARAQLADALGFAALWLRDVPFNVPSFGDVGQMFDPFVYLGTLGQITRDIALGVASVVLPLRHPAHVAKAAATADVLSGGRLLLGAASGDRPEEYPALNQSFADRGARFRDSIGYIRAMAEAYPQAQFAQGHLSGAIDILPKPQGQRLPLLITGGSRQSPQWIAQNGDGWMTYPRPIRQRQDVVASYRTQVRAAGLPDKPVMQSLYIDLADDPAEPARPIHLGFRSGMSALLDYLKQLEAIGVNHVALNLRFTSGAVETTMERLAAELLPEFSHKDHD
ncbi:LLM class oxidoreductase [Leisingera sp. JC1]|uniref:LLM class oxidoreductase n=1 Tax=Leisingera sp. JC1 TaxID=1855282 RepID=UPI0008036BCB|nr:LLM class oxidoreductase [Leisingera sp. JC1]OBY25150.1 LLM class oxidoreductase [Leisingera sp. JC1]